MNELIGLDVEEATIILRQIFPVSTKGNIIMGKLKDVFKVDKPIIGMVHLRPLPGSPNMTR